MTLHTLTPAWINSLRCLHSILGKAQAHAKQANFDPGALFDARLFPDMFAFPRQVQIATDVVARAGARLTQQELPNFPDTETSFAALQARCEKAIEYIGSLSPDAFEGAEERMIDVPVGGGNTMPMSGGQYVYTFVIPNFYFHLTTAYNLLRTNGVPLGKRDFLRSEG